MLKKILKYTFRTLLVILLVLMLVPALLYIPAVQDFVRGKAVGYASRTLGMDLSVERLRLSFPLRLSVDNTLLSDKGDTLLSCGHLSLDVAVWPLLRKEVAVRSLELAKLAARLDPAPGFLAIDGNRFRTRLELPYRCIVKGDGKYADIAAASVLAKTHRDEYMLRLAEEFPQYGWRKNKGYPTREHRLAIREYGLTPHHRLTFNHEIGQLELAF